jgi:hypothetical protein
MGTSARCWHIEHGMNLTAQVLISDIAGDPDNLPDVLLRLTANPSQLAPELPPWTMRLPIGI